MVGCGSSPLAATVDVSTATGASVVAVATALGASVVAVTRSGADETVSLGTLGTVVGRAAPALPVLPSPPACRAAIPRIAARLIVITRSPTNKRRWLRVVRSVAISFPHFFRRSDTQQTPIDTIWLTTDANWS
jgi:hypothetical protein